MKQLLVGPLIGFLDGLGEVELICIVLYIDFDFFGKGAFDLTIASFEDVDIFASNQYSLCITLKEWRNHLVFQQKFLLPISPLNWFFINVDHELAMTIFYLPFIDPPRQDGNVQLNQLMVQMLVDEENMPISRVINKFQQATN